MFPFLSPLHLLKLPRPQTAAPSGVAGSVLTGRLDLILGWHQLLTWGFKHRVISNCPKAQQGRLFKRTESPQTSGEGSRAIRIWAGLKSKSFLFGVARDFFSFWTPDVAESILLRGWHQGVVAELGIGSSWHASPWLITSDSEVETLKASKGIWVATWLAGQLSHLGLVWTIWHLGCKSRPFISHAHESSLVADNLQAGSARFMISVLPLPFCGPGSFLFPVPTSPSSQRVWYFHSRWLAGIACCRVRELKTPNNPNRSG